MVFTTPIGTAVDPDNLTKAYKALLRGAGLRGQRFHDPRHTAATLMLRDGLPRKRCQPCSDTRRHQRL